MKGLSLQGLTRLPAADGQDHGAHTVPAQEDEGAQRQVLHYPGRSGDGECLLLVHPGEAQGPGPRPEEDGGAGEGHGRAQDEDDVRWQPDGQLPTSGRQTKLLQVHHLKPGLWRGGHRLHAGGV